jgi:lysophospholipase L1-like esterase
MDRPRAMFAPDLTFFICYADDDVLKRDWLDAKGRVLNHVNHFGLRERDEIRPDNKQPRERRLVCIGDSFTYGGGIPAELGWVRLLENELRHGDGDVRTVNCGAAGTVCVDEYWWGLKHRFHVFQPDAVVMTLCLNDLIPSSGVNFFVLPKPSGCRVLDLLVGALGPRPIDLDPGRDWVAELMSLSKADAEAAQLCHPTEKPWEAMWAQGVPQQCMREAKAWCGARSIPFLVVLWPFLQGLGPGRHYPFQKLHDLVAADCAAAGIAFLDVLPALRDTPDEDLWVTPADPHPNPRAQRLVLPAITGFVRAHTRW